MLSTSTLSSCLCRWLTELPCLFQDSYSGTDFAKKEVQDPAGVVTGEYRVALPDGRIQIVTYTADHYNGYVADVRSARTCRGPPHAPLSQVRGCGGLPAASPRRRLRPLAGSPPRAPAPRAPAPRWSPRRPGSGPPRTQAWRVPGLARQPGGYTY